jgi:Ran GTPase-activating protein (RanGAP) involved in mRNA processing and transport
MRGKVGLGKWGGLAKSVQMAKSWGGRAKAAVAARHAVPQIHSDGGEMRAWTAGEITVLEDALRVYPPEGMERQQRWEEISKLVSERGPCPRTKRDCHQMYKQLKRLNRDGGVEASEAAENQLAENKLEDSEAAANQLAGGADTNVAPATNASIASVRHRLSIKHKREATAASAAKMRDQLKNSESCPEVPPCVADAWSLEQWVASVSSIHSTLATAILKTKLLSTSEQEHFFLFVDPSSIEGLVRNCVHELAAGINEARAKSAAQWNPAACNPALGNMGVTSSSVLVMGSASKAFCTSLEARIGNPVTPNIFAQMEWEHTASPWANVPLTYGTGNQYSTTPKKEWNIAVHGCTDVAVLGDRPAVRSLAAIMKIASSGTNAGDEPLEAEVLGAVLYSGPMGRLYNSILHQGTAAKEQPESAQDILVVNLSDEHKFTTSLHAINSFISASKNFTPCKVWRGIDRKATGRQTTDMSVRGGARIGTDTVRPWHVGQRWCDPGFASFTADKATIPCSPSTVLLEAQTSQGADLAQISQYPSQREVVFSPSIDMTVLGTCSAQHTAVIVPIHISCTRRARRIAGFTNNMKQLHLQAIEGAEADCAAMCFPRAALEGLRVHRTYAQDLPSAWFTHMDNFVRVTKLAMQAKAAAISNVLSTRQGNANMLAVANAAASAIGSPSSMIDPSAVDDAHLELILATLPNTPFSDVDLQGTSTSDKAVARFVRQIPPALQRLAFGRHQTALAIESSSCVLDFSKAKLACGDVMIIAAFLRHCPKLQSLSLPPTRLSLEVVDMLAESIHFVSSKLNIAEATIPEEEQLRLGEALVQNQCSRIAFVVSRDWAVTERTTSLNLSNANLKHSDVLLLAGCCRNNSVLLQLDISKNGLLPKSCTAIAKMLEVNTAIQKVNISLNPFGLEGAESFASMMESNNTITSVIFGDRTAVELATGMTEANLGGCHLGTPEAVLLASFMPKCSKCEILRLNGNNLLSARSGMALQECLAKNKVITALDLSKNKCQDVTKPGSDPTDFAAQLGPVFEGRSGSAVTNLTISGCFNVSEPLTMDTSMTTADFSGKCVDTGAAMLMASFMNRCQALTCLTFGDFRPLVMTVNMIEADFSHSDFGQEEAIQFTCFLPRASKLTNLNLSDNVLCKDSIKVLSDAFAVNQVLSHINVWNNRFMDSGGADLLADAIAKNCGALSSIVFGDSLPPVEMGFEVTELSFRGRALGPDCAQIIGAGLTHCHMLERLDLAQTDLTHSASNFVGIQAICSALAQHGCPVKRLDLSGNDLGLLGYQSVGEVITASSELSTLVLNNTNPQIIADSFGEVFRALITDKQPSVTELQLGGNFLQEKDFVYCWKLLSKKGPLTALDISRNTLEYKSAKEIAHGLRANQSTNFKLGFNGGYQGALVFEEGDPLMLDTVTAELVDYEDRGLGSVGALLVAALLTKCRALISINLLSNAVGMQEAAALIKASRELMQARYEQTGKKSFISLCGLIQDQGLLDLSHRRIDQADAMLVAADIAAGAKIHSILFLNGTDHKVLNTDGIRYNSYTTNYTDDRTSGIDFDRDYLTAGSIVEYKNHQCRVQKVHSEHKMELQSIIKLDSNMSTIDVSTRDMSAAACLVAAAFIRTSCPKLVSLTFGEKPVTVNSFVEFCDLSNRGIDSRGAVILSAFIPHCKKMTLLDVSKNEICGYYASSMKSAEKSPDTEVFHKDASGIDALATAVSLSTVLTRLNFLCNHFEMAHGNVLLQAKEDSNSLRAKIDKEHAAERLRVLMCNREEVLREKRQYEEVQAIFGGTVTPRPQVGGVAVAPQEHPKLPKLTTLCGIPPDAVSLDFSTHNLCPGDIVMVTGDLKHNDGVLLVNLLGSTMHPLQVDELIEIKTSKTLCRILKTLCGINKLDTILDLRHQPLGSGCARLLASEIEQNEHLKVMLFDSRPSDVVPGAPLFEPRASLQLDSEMEEADLKGAQLDADLATVLIAFLPRCAALQLLIVSGCGIPEEQALVLAQVCKQYSIRLRNRTFFRGPE